jgi:hypothetical protein
MKQVTDAKQQYAGGGSLTIPVWYNGIGLDSRWWNRNRNYHRKGVVLNGSFIASDYSLGSNIHI